MNLEDGSTTSETGTKVEIMILGEGEMDLSNEDRGQ